ncbi:hypothetical protein LCGC14_2194930, partial [marine sediment metagenome]
ILYGPMNSTYEAYAIILKELDEFWREACKGRENRSKSTMRKELTQIAAMAIRAIHDLDLYFRPISYSTGRPVLPS